jgi:hypothetical protein
MEGRSGIRIGRAIMSKDYIFRKVLSREIMAGLGVTLIK